MSTVGDKLKAAILEMWSEEKKIQVKGIERTSSWKIWKKTENKMEGCGGEKYERKGTRWTEIADDDTLERPTLKWWEKTKKKKKKKNFR